MNKRKKIGGGFMPDLEEYERENQIKPKTENELDETESFKMLELLKNFWISKQLRRKKK